MPQKNKSTKQAKSSPGESDIEAKKGIFIINYDTLLKTLSSTDSNLGGTVTAVNHSISRLEQKVSKVERGILKYDAIRNELENLKNSVADLEELRKPIKEVEDFLKDRIEFVTTAVEAKGRFNVIDNELASMQKRLGYLEDKSSKTKDRNIAIWAVVISILSVLSSIVIAIFWR